MSMYTDFSGTNIEQNDSTPSIENKHIDQLTLELLINKTQYEKYLAKNEPQKWSEKQIFLANCEKYYIPMMKITSQFIKNPNIQLSIDVNHAFLNYAQCLIRHLEIEEIANVNEGSENEDEDEDVLFPYSSMRQIEEELEDDNQYSAFEDFSRDDFHQPVKSVPSNANSKSKPNKCLGSFSKMNYLSNDFFCLAKKNNDI